MNAFLAFLSALFGNLQVTAKAPKKVDGKPTAVSNLDLIKEFEGLRLMAYLPTPRDVWTIGYGHTRTAKPGMVITKAEAERLLREDLAWVRRAIKELVEVPLSQEQYDALASFIYNLGRTNFASSTLLRKLNAGDYRGAANEFPRWVYQKGTKLRGLVRRRAHERELFLKGTK